jgi:CBS domain containing-hemolysin-like protein
MILELILTFILVIANGFFVATEFAMAHPPA